MALGKELSVDCGGLLQCSGAGHTGFVGPCWGTPLGDTWTSKMPRIMDPILPILSILGYWAIILGTLGGPGTALQVRAQPLKCTMRSSCYSQDIFLQ